MSNHIRLLLIEDNPGDARLIEEFLKEAKHSAIDFLWRENLRDGLECIGHAIPHVIILDLGLADSQGLDSLVRIRKVAGHVPVIIMTGTDDEELGIRAMTAGAQDYIVKGTMGPESLERIIRYAIERKRSEAELNSYLSFLETLINTIPNPVFYKDLQGRYLGCNDAFSDKILGLPKEAIVGHTLFDFSDKLLPEMAERYHQTDIDLIRNGGDQYYQARVRCSDNKFREFFINKAVYHDSSGRMAGLIGVMQDISKQKQHEKRLEVSNRILNLLNQYSDIKSTIRNILTLIKESFNIDALGIRLKKNDDFPYYETNGFSDDFMRTEKYLYARDENDHPVTDENGHLVLECMCGIVLCEKTDPNLPFFTEYGSFWTNSTSALINSGYWKELQTWTRNRCNYAGYESVALIPLRVDNETIGLLQLNNKTSGSFSLSLIAFFEGIGPSIGISVQRMTAEQTLIESEARYRQLYDNMSSGVAVYEAVDDGNDFVFKDINPAGEKISRKAKAQILGRRISDIFPGVRDMGLFDVLRSVHKTGIPAHLPITLYRDDRFSQWVENNVFKLATGEIVVVYDDKTREIEEEAEKKELLGRLQQAQKMESIGTLAGGIAHDFNNILSAIIGFSELAMERAKEDDDLLDDLSEIMKAGTRAKELVKQILTFSRQTDHEPKPLRADAMVNEVAHLMRSTLPSFIKIEKSIETTGEIMADPTHIHQVLMNLCTNAFHAMRTNGGVLGIGLRTVVFDMEKPPPMPDMPPGTYVNISIADTGTGIAPDILPRIFDPYFTTKDKGEGTGLGLAVAHGVIQDHKGHIMVRSDVGRGTTFDIFFPAIKDPTAFTAPKPAIELPRGTERILFVDDEPSILKVNKIRLERLGYHVFTENQSSEALALFAKQPDAFDLIITDMTMPELTGDQLAGKCLEIRPGIPIILCTGYSDIISETKAKEIGIREYVMKPILIQDIAAAIRRAVERGKS